MPKLATFKTAKFEMISSKTKALKSLAKTNYINTLYQAPTKNTPYVYQGKKYGQPTFRLKRRGGEVTMESDSFWFTKDEDTEEVKLNCVIEVCREEEDVYPLLIKNTSVHLQYQLNGREQSLPLKITQSPFIRSINILQNIHAEAVVKKEHVKPITEAISTMGMSKLVIKSELWWQAPASTVEDSKPKPVIDPVIRKRRFNYKTLKITGNNITNSKGAVLWKCKNRAEAIKVFRVLRIYRFDTEVIVGKYGSFKYLLSQNKIPTAAKFNGEDILSLERTKLKIKKVNNKWGIYGSRLHYNFNDDEAGAKEALRVINAYQADYKGYAVRPKPTLNYLKSTKRKQVFNAGFVLKPQIHLAHVVKPAVAMHVVNTAKPKTPSTPQKIDLNHSIILFYEKDNPSVFGNLNDNITAVESKWKYKSIPKDGENFTIYYRGTAQPDTFSFLPQVYRIRVNENSGEPKIMITMVSGDDPNIIEQYRIRVNIQLLPYYHPKAKKDLYETLSDLTSGEIKHCKVVLDNYNSAAFEINEIEVSDLVVLNSNIPEKIENINPVSGFSISLDCTFESFDVLKRKLKDGFNVGNVIFELVEETDEGESVISSQPIPVELDLRKLAGIPVGVEVMEPNNSDEEGIPSGIKLFNENSFPVKAKGVELTLLSEINDTVYEADLDIGNTRNDWPITIAENKQAFEEILLNQADIDELTDENRFWTDLICEPYGIYIDEEPETIMERVIDYATGDPQIWELQIECLLFQSWDSLDEELLQPYKGISKVAIEIKQDEETTPLGVVLSKQNSSSTIQMARSISQILHSQQLGDRRYQYRIKTYYVLEEKDWTEWTNPESTAANYLSIYPQKLQD